MEPMKTEISLCISRLIGAFASSICPSYNMALIIVAMLCGEILPASLPQHYTLFKVSKIL